MHEEQNAPTAGEGILRLWNKGGHQTWNLETWFLGAVGAAMIWQADFAAQMNVIQQTIILVIFLGGLMGITRIPFPSKIAGKVVPVWIYPILAGLISGFMDSFLVLLLLGTCLMKGSADHQFKFKVYNMEGALTGGQIMYFGEVYVLPLALMYGMHKWYSMLPVIPPVAIFLILLAVLSRRLNVEVVGMKESENGGHTASWVDYAEFAIAIALLLALHNPMLMLGGLFVYSSLSGQGHDLIEVMKTETEVGVMLLLVLALLIAGPAAAFLIDWNITGPWALIPSGINAVLLGAVFPASGNFWHDLVWLSGAVMLTPLSSLVGVMLFKTKEDWLRYMKISIPLSVVWIGLMAGWFYGVWPHLEDSYYDVTGFERPALMVSTHAPAQH